MLLAAFGGSYAPDVKDPTVSVCGREGVRGKGEGGEGVGGRGERGLGGGEEGGGEWWTAT